MHSCLQINELVAIIAEGIIDELLAEDWRGNLTHMALTCRTFYEPAMNALWRTLPTISALWLALPDNRVYRRWEDEYASLRASLISLPPCDSNEWDRVRMNARRVRILDLEVIEDPASFDDYLQLEGLTMAALRDSYPHLPLFLNASALRMDVEGCWLGLGLHFNVMTSPRGLQELDIGSDGHGDVATVSRILRSPHSQALQKLKLWMIFSSSNGQPASSKDIAELAASIASIGTLRRLKFHCDDGSSAAWLVALVSHPNLEDLDTGPFPGTYSITPSLNKPLRSLQRLRLGNEFGRPIRLDQLDPHTSFLSALSSCPLRELSIEIDMTTSDDSHRAPRLQELLSAISCLKTLEHLAVFSDVDQYSVPGAVLSSLFSIRTLRVVKMDTIPLRLDGGAVRQMASSWRDIEHLSLGPDVPYKDPTMISVHDLSPFANHCPRLETLQMQIIETQTQRPAERTTAQTLLRTLFFGQSRVPEGDLQAIASFVDEVFPETYVSFSDPGTTFQLLALIDELSWSDDDDSEYWGEGSESSGE